MNESSFNHDFIPDGTFEAELSDDKIGAIKYAINLGRIIQEQYAGVAEDYRSGMSLSGIVEKYQFAGVFHCRPKTAEQAVANAIRGYDGHLQIADEKPFTGLISDQEELSALALAHNAESSRTLGHQLKDEGRGLFAIPPEERSEIGRRSGNQAFDNKTGIHAQTPEERRQLGKEGVRAQGGEPYSDDELRYILELALDASFQRQSRINAMKIAEAVNNKFHDGETVRSSHDIVKIYSRLKSGERKI